MIVVVLGLLVIGLTALIVLKERRSAPRTPFDRESELKAALRLARLNTELKVRRLKHEQRRDAIRLRRDIAEVLDDSSDGEYE